MRIGLVTGEYPPLQGGVGDFTRELGRALVALGEQVYVLTSTRARPQAPDGVTVEPLVAAWGWQTPAAIAGWARARRLDVVNLQYQAAAYGMGLPIHMTTWWWRVRREPFASVVTYHDLRVPYLFPKAGALRARAVFGLGRNAGALIVTNADDERAWNQAVPDRPAHNVPIGSNISPDLPAGYNRQAWRARYGLTPGDLLIGYFGFLNASKGGDTLLGAFERLVARGRPAHLLLIGGEHGASDPTNQAYAARLRERVQALGLQARVHRTGFVSNADVSAALQAADVLALPYRDGASTRRGSLLAALAHGCAVVTTYPPATAPGRTPLTTACDYLLRVPPDDAEALAEAITFLADQPDARHALGARALLQAQAYGWDRIAAQTLAVYRQARREAAG